MKWCKLQPDALRAASVWMQGFGQFEPVNLEAFERFLQCELEDTPATLETPFTSEIPVATEVKES